MGVTLSRMGTTASRALPQLNARLNLAVRAAAVAAILFAEKFLLNLLVVSSAPRAAQGFGAVVRTAQHWGFRFLVTLAAALALFCYVRGGGQLREINREAQAAPVRIPRLLAHLVLVLALAPLTFFLYNPASPLPFAWIVVLWLALGAPAVVALLTAAAPWDLWRRAARATGVLWLYAGAAALVSASVMEWSEKLWDPTAALTFELVRHALAPLMPSLHGNAATHVLYTDHFAIKVAEGCSGLEGIGLMLTFCCAWLIYFRKEYIFPRALILVPAGLLLIFALNVVRIATLMMIGNAGFPAVALYGFHSQAGWIAFNVAAGGLAYSTRYSSWFNRTARESSAGATDNPTAAYLVPFLSILAAGMLARAVSNGFESLYVLRFIAAAIAIRVYWPRLKELNWRFSWRGPLIGILVFAIWIAAAPFFLRSSTMPRTLIAMDPATRTLWIVIRVAASVITVPIAEELAYRGYLMRRIVAEKFEALPFAAVSLGPLLVSAAVFGVTHGSLWLPGIISGVMFAAVLVRTGRFGEAVAAHAVANGLVAAYVLLANQWQLW
jgi:exosortase E/protease (VPEID-CTERM system)